jgi:predicted nucleotidyltransferase
LKTNSPVKEQPVPGVKARITTAPKDKNLRKRAPHIPPHISRIIWRFVKDTNRLLQKNVIAKYLFGSYATNTYTPLSDIDILIVVNTFSPEIRRQMSGLASEYSLEYDVYISPIIKDLQVWNKNIQYQTLFYQEVTQHGIQL